MCNMYVWLNITPFFRSGSVLQPDANEVSVEEVFAYKAHIKGETDLYDEPAWTLHDLITKDDGHYEISTFFDYLKVKFVLAQIKRWKGWELHVMLKSTVV